MNVILNSVIQILFVVLDFYKWIVIANVAISWLVAFHVINTSNQFVHMIMDFTYRLTEPLYRRIRALMPNFGGVDLSPMVVLLGVMFMQSILSQTAARMM